MRQRYRKLSYSGVEWLGDIPAHWSVGRLKNSAKCWVSNVDKVPSDEELPVRLCNYTDVYYNENIHPSIGLMESTATPEEIQRFGLKINDVLITKDSEEWSDIAVPALVVETAPDLVCAYHLAIIRPDSKKLLGRFLLRTLQSCAVNQQFQVAASGVTRYGLPKSSIGDAWVPIPAYSEQLAIANFLDRKTAEIDTLIAKKRKLIEKLKEKRSALIARTVTRGLPPEAARAAGFESRPKMKSSGIEWLGDVPEHWRVIPLKWCARSSSGDSISNDELERESSEVAQVPVIGGNGVMGFSAKYNTTETVLAVGRVGALCGNVHLVDSPAWITDNALVLKWDHSVFDARFLVAVLVSRNLNELAEKTAQPLITGSQLRDQRMLCPPVPEQLAIADFLDRQTAKIDALMARVDQAIERLQEYRTALITAAVTGKIDVRQEQSGVSRRTGHDGQDGREKAGARPARRSVHA